MITAQEAIERLEQKSQSYIGNHALREIAELIRHQQREIEESEINFRLICLALGFDPSDGEGTSFEQVTKYVEAVVKERDELEQQLAANDHNQDPPGFEQKL